MTDEEFNQKKAIVVIRNYLEAYNLTDDEIMEKYEIAVLQLIKNSEKLEKVKNSTVGIKSQTQGDRSTTFADGVEAWTITDDIKALLPTPNNFYRW